MNDWHFDPTVYMCGFPEVGDGMVVFLVSPVSALGNLSFVTAYQLIGSLSIFFMLIQGQFSVVKQ